MKHKRRSAFFTSLVSLVLCVAMLTGTTFAWFTDTVTSSVNRIAAGDLDVTLEYLSDGKWKSVQDSTSVFDPDALWEPGHTEVVYLRISNAGQLALKYQLGIHIAKETGSINAAGNPFVLSDYIEFSAIKDVKTPYASREDARKAVTSSTILSAGYDQQDSILPGGEPHYVALVVYMPESVGNDANHATGVEAPHIEMGLHLFATQQTYESDSFGNSYDSAVEFPLNNVNVTVAAPIHNNAENGVIANTMSVGNTGSGITAEIPQGVALDAGAKALTLSVRSLETSEANIALEQGETKTSLDIHIDGVAADNTVPMLITLDRYFPTGLNSTSVALYHVENGITLQMTQTANPTNHNEFSYDPATGTVVLCVASFSEYVAVTDDFNRWEGTLDISWYNDTATEFTLTTAEQLAGFGAIVDGGYKKSDGTWVDIPADTFEGKTVRLGKDINLGGKISFNPIGCGYVTGVGNSGSVTGCAFMGTFDGNGYTISGLYQNGWDLGLSYCNLGGGLFASVCDATIQNLTITNANIVMECVEMGIVVGLSQGDCTYKNINIYNSKIANYQRPTGGLIGEVSPGENGGGTTNITDVTIGPYVVVGSLWGDFDCPVGGVIGARWDDGNTIMVNMTNVTVSARLDVYNDVTSTYQWYAYRRAGMLIGNTDMSAKNENGTNIATADFLTCSNVKVYYGPWVDYHYCQFTNYKPSWPWVRVEAGENCDAYSNPRYGVPNDISGNKVTDAHTTANHQTGDLCRELIEFNQLYGGGQGVYGQAKHDGVTVESYIYTITYVNDSKVLDIVYVADNTKAVSTENEDAKELVVKWAAEHIEGTVEFGGWMNAGSTKVPTVSAYNEEDIVLYPSFAKPYTASFVDQNGNILAWCFFNENDTAQLEATKEIATNKLPDPGENFELDYWNVRYENEKDGKVTVAKFSVNNFAGYTVDVTIYPVYKYEGDVRLIPVDEDGDGDTDYYQVAGYGATTGEQELVEIPGEVNSIPVTTINADAFSSYDDLHSVRIPAKIESINSQAFTADDTGKWGNQRDTVTLYYEGDPAVWKTAMELYNADNYSGILKASWDNMMGDGSRVFFLDANGKVINTMYWELNDDWVWVLHEHAYTYEAAQNCSHGAKSHYEYGGGFLGLGASLQEEKFTNYAGSCDCNSCNGATRPDAEYWTTTTTE